MGARATTGKCMKPIDTFETLVSTNSWNEMDIHFPPSYCYKEGSSEFQVIKDGTRNLTMSHADRVIWKNKSSCKVTGVKYGCIIKQKDLGGLKPSEVDVKDLQGSDHQPVYASFTVRYTGKRRLLGPTCYRKLPVMERLLELIQRQ